jgi:hypothetical protein
MTKKRLLLIASLPLFIIVTLGVLAMLPPDDRPGVTKANFDRIEKGMTLDEVEGIFGRVEDMDVMPDWHGPGRLAIWCADDGVEARITFENDCVTEKSWFPSDETIPHKIRRWLHLQ